MDSLRSAWERLMSDEGIGDPPLKPPYVDVTSMLWMSEEEVGVWLEAIRAKHAAFRKSVEPGTKVLVPVDIDGSSHCFAVSHCPYRGLLVRDPLYGENGKPFYTKYWQPVVD